MTLPPHQYYLLDGNIAEYSIEYLRGIKLNEINNWRDYELSKPVEYFGHLFDFDQASQFRVMAVVMLGTGSPTGFWTTYNNLDVPADNAFMQGLYVAMLTRFSTIHAQQRTMKTAIELMTNVADIAAYGVPQQ